MIVQSQGSPSGGYNTIGFVASLATTLDFRLWDGPKQVEELSCEKELLARSALSRSSRIPSVSFPSFLTSLQETTQKPLHLFSGLLTTLALAFDHASGDKRGPRAGRVLEERPDMRFGLNRVLVHT